MKFIFLSLMVISKVVMANCLDLAADRFGENRLLLRSIAYHESGYRPTAFHRNQDGSYDIGFMQINSSLLPWLKSKGISEHALYDTCTNIWVGTYILATFQQKYGNTWRAVGAYGAGSRRDHERARQTYASMIYKTYMHIMVKQQRHREPEYAALQ